MVVWKIAFTEYGDIRRIIPSGVVQSVRCVEMLLSAYGHWMHHDHVKGYSLRSHTVVYAARSGHYNIIGGK
jgi:hypothetical protein